MIFEEVFLQSQNNDCLGLVLSFLACKDLAHAARTCKLLQHTIFEADHDYEEGNVNLIWQGAEEALANPGDQQQDIFEGKSKRWRIGSNAREECHLFAVASKAAKACELLDGIEENRIMVDGVLADLMNVRGFDAESIAEKKAIGANETKTVEDEFSFEVDFLSDEEAEEMKQNLLEEETEKELERRDKWERLANLKAPEQTWNHYVFVRITRTETREMISEGFCLHLQKLPWYAGLEKPHDDCQLSQGLQIILDFESLNQSEEMKKFLAALEMSPEFDTDIFEQGPGINVTAVVIDKRNRSTRCLFQHDQTQETGLKRIGQATGALPPFYHQFKFAANPRWGSDSVQLGPSVAEDMYLLGFSLPLCVTKKQKNGCMVVVPLLEVDVEKDCSAFKLWLDEQIQAHRINFD